MSLRDTILGADDLESEVVDVPEWGVSVLVRGMTGKQRMRLVEQTQAKNRDLFYSDILIALVFDPETGDPIFDPADREALAGKSGAVLERISQKAIGLSGVSVEDAEKAIDADPT